jgi:hypothetical protein
MVNRSPEGGDKPGNQGLSSFKVLREQHGVGPRVQKTDEPKQQPADADRTLYERFHGGRRRSGVAGGEAHTRNMERLRRALERNDKEQAEHKG